MKVIPYGRQSIGPDDIKAVLQVLKSDWLTQGPAVEMFEKELALICGAKFAVAVSSATAGLHLACLALDLKKGDEVITTPITFLATSNAVLYAGGKPVFADISSYDINLDPLTVEKKISRKVRAILPVHFSGRPCNMPALHKQAKENGLRIIEDASHALGAEYQSGGKWIRAGSCRHSDMTVFSFHPVKLITAGEGGAITTNDETLYRRLKALRSHGVYKDTATENIGPWYYEMRHIGFNYRMTDIQCALGISQLKKLKRFIARREHIAAAYRKAFKDISCLRLPPSDADFKSAHHLFVVQIDFVKLGKSRKDIMCKLKEKGVGTQVHYIPVYQQPFYRELGFKQNQCPKAEAYYKQALSLPIFPDMKDSDVKAVISQVKKVLK